MQKYTKICVVGLGYIGLPTASTFCSCGVQVLGVDINTEIIDILLSGKIHIHEPGLLELAQSAIQSGRLQVGAQPQEAEAFIIAVPTPFYDGKKADLRAVKAAAESIVPVLRKGNLVVLESTSPPQTTARVVAPILEKSGLKAGEDFYLAYSPERVLPGQILRELIENDRVIGGITPESAEEGKRLYGCFVRGNIHLTDATTAEMVKLMENTYRDVNIAIANEFSRLADRFGVNIWEAIQIANRHPRVNILKPGIGVGGHCISVDPWFFVEAAPDLAQLIYTARVVNDTQPEFVLQKLKETYGDISGKTVSVLGLAYKPDVDDLRESPAVEFAKLLQKENAVVKAYEPFSAHRSEMDGVPIISTLEGAICDADIIVLLVVHTQFLEYDPVQIALITRCRNMFDALNGWNGVCWLQAGFNYQALGEPSNEKAYAAD